MLKRLSETKMNLSYFLLIPISLILLINIIYLAFGVMFFSHWGEKPFANFFLSAGYVASIAFLDICFFCLIVFLTNKFLKNYFFTPFQEFYDDMQTFHKTNKNGFVNWSQKIIKSPAEIVEMQRYFHDNIAKNIYELHNHISCDSLTGLRTNIILKDDLENAPSHAIAVLNINGFKEINSFYGVKSADKILCSIANLLKSYFKNEQCLLYRIYGDNFAILWSNYADKELFINQLEGLLSFLSRQEIVVDGYASINVAVTIGIAFSYDGAKYSMVHAMIALHHAKAYKNPIVIYNSSLPILNVLRNNIQYTEVIYQALRNQDIIPYYQKIDGVQDYLNDTRVKYEALMRIKDKEGHVIPPGLFLEISKHSNVYLKLSRLMLEKVFANLVLCENCVFSVNLALEDMLAADFSIWFIDRIVHYNLEDRVIVEITEQESIENFESVSSFVGNIKELGIKIALDDFGSGYSNFSILMKLSIDYLKIDSSLIKNIDKDVNAKMIVETIVSLAKRLKIYTVAEFVSSKETYEMIKEIGVDYAQGYYIGKPVAKISNP